MSDQAATAHIRLATIVDAALLAAFAEHSFCDTYAADNNPHDMRLHVEQRFGLQQQSAELLNPDMRTLLAIVEAKILGFAQIRQHTAPDVPDCVAEHLQSQAVLAPATIELHRFYVDRSAHGTGLAQRLMQAVAQTAKGWANPELAGPYLWLSVWDQNPRAIAFYQKQGWIDVGTGIYVVGNDRQTDRIMFTMVASILGTAKE